MELEPLGILACTTWLWVFKFGFRLPKNCHQLVSVRIHNPRCAHSVSHPLHLWSLWTDRPISYKSSPSVVHYLMTSEFLAFLALRSVFWDVRECSLEDDTKVSEGFAETLAHTLLVVTLHFQGWQMLLSKVDNFARTRMNVAFFWKMAGSSTARLGGVLK